MHILEVVLCIAFWSVLSFFSGYIAGMRDAKVKDNSNR